MAGTKRFHYGWIIAVMSFLIIFLTIGMCNSSQGIYLLPVTASTSMNRAQFTSISSCKFLSATVCNMLFGFFKKRFGLKKLVVSGTILIALSFVIYSRANSPAIFYFGGILQGMGDAFAAVGLISSLINNWFSDHKGTVLGVVFSSSGLGGSVFSCVVTFMIANIGWRNSYMVSAILMFICSVMSFLVIREKPSDMGLEPVGGYHYEDAGTVDQINKKLSLNDAIKNPIFYLVMLSSFFIGVINNPIYSALPSHMADKGMEDYSALIMSILFLAIAVFKIVLGVINDKTGYSSVLCIEFLANILGLILLLTADSLLEFFAFAVVFGISVPMGSMLIPLTIYRVFGVYENGTFLGVSLALVSAGVAVGNPLMGWCSDISGSYNSMIFIFLCVAAIVFIMMLYITKKTSMGSLYK